MNSTEQFFTLLAHYPSISMCWDREKQEYRPGMLERIEGRLSQHELTALKCLRSIWSGYQLRGENTVNLSQIAELSREFKQPLLDWLSSPFWP